MPFEIHVHAEAPVVEITYPAEPTAQEVADYTLKVKRVIDAQTGPWYCLVDQRLLERVSPKLLSKIALLNSYAQKRGMLRSARVVATSVSGLQVLKIAEEGDLRAPVRSFKSREEALAWLLGGER